MHAVEPNKMHAEDIVTFLRKNLSSRSFIGGLNGSGVAIQGNASNILASHGRTHHSCKFCLMGLNTRQIQRIFAERKMHVNCHLCKSKMINEHFDPAGMVGSATVFNTPYEVISFK